MPATPQIGAAQPSPPDSPDAIRVRYSAWERRSLDEAQPRARLDALGNGRDPLEGIWVSADGSYRVAVLRDTVAGRDLVMTILRADSVFWTPGQVKAAFTRAADGGLEARFYMRS